MSGVEERAYAPMIVRAVTKGQFVRANDSFKAKVGFDDAALAEKPFLDWIAPCDRAGVQAALENGEKSLFARHITRDGGTLPLRIRVEAHGDDLFVLGRFAEAPHPLEPDGAKSSEASVLGTLDAIARIVEEQHPGYKCSILLVADGRFVFGAGPSLPEEYNAAVNGFAVGPNVGSCGTAIFWNTPVIVENIQADPLWAPLADLAKNAGVAACWSHPFSSSSGNVLGALALYSPVPRAPTVEQLRQLQAAARMTGLAVERGRAEEDLKRAERAVNVAHSQLKATLNALPDLLFDVDSHGRILSYHGHRPDLLLVPPEAFLGRRFAEVLPPGAAAAVQQAIDEAAQSGCSYGMTYPLVMPRGERWFELSVAVGRVDATSAQHFVVVSRDITDRKQLEAALSREMATLDTLLNTLPDLVWLKDADGVYLNCNNRFEQFFGAPASSIIGKTDYDFVNRELADSFREKDRKAMEINGPSVNEEDIVFRSDGHREIIETTMAPMRDAAGTLVGVLGIGHDVTQRKRTEAALCEARNVAVAASQAKSQFLATMSHEIRTPMNAVLGMAQLLLMPDIGENDRYRYAGIILNSGQTLLGLLNDILDLSKVESGMLEIERVACDPQQIAEEVASLFAESAQAKGLSIQSLYHGTHGQRYLADPARLRQVLSNLVGNAIKFTGHGLVRLEVTELERKGSSALLEFAVTDSGIGIPPDRQASIWQPFTQADSSTTRQYGGTGLGLSIVRALAQLMGGEVGVESEVGIGSRFWCRIHADVVPKDGNEREAERRPETAQTIPIAGKKVGRALVVEDNPVNRIVLQELLKKLSFQSDTAENGTEAINVITKGTHWDVVLMDIHMPVLDGLEATECIRRWETETGQPHLPIIALTACAFDEDRQRCAAAGMDDYVSKPVDLDKLAAVLSKWATKGASEVRANP